MSVLAVTAGPPQQDYIILAAEISPGFAIVKGAGAPRNWDIRQGYAFSGATSVYTGDTLAKFSVQIMLWDDSQWADWDDFAKLLEKPPSGQRPQAMEIRHPLLNRSPIKITSVVVEDVSQFEQDEYGLWWCEIKFLQFRKPKAVLAQPVASTPKAENAPPRPADALDGKIAAAVAEHDALGQNLAGGVP